MVNFSEAEVEVDPDVTQFALPSTDDVIKEAQLQLNSDKNSITDQSVEQGTSDDDETEEQPQVYPSGDSEDFELPNSMEFRWSQVSPGACETLTADHLQWLFCSGMTCYLSIRNLLALNFISGQDLISRLKRDWSSSDPTAPWRCDILHKIACRDDAFLNYLHQCNRQYEVAIESSNWTKVRLPLAMRTIIYELVCR